MPAERQLYTLFGQLEHYVQNQDERGSIIGYTLADSVLHFSTTSGAPQDIKFEQVKDFYRLLEENIDHCKTDQSQNPGFNIFCTLEARLSQELNYDTLQKYLTPELEPDVKKKENRTNLRNGLIKYLTTGRQGYEDRLRRLGLALMDSVRASRPRIGTRDILTQDYNTIEGLFK